MMLAVILAVGYKTGMRTREQHAERERYRNQGKRIWIAANGPIPTDESGRPFHIHHKDRNWRNNSVENLECVSRKAHEVIHADERRVWSELNLTKFRIGNQWGKANRGQVKSAETREKIAAAKRGVPMPEETRRKIALSAIGKNKGRKKSDEEIARREAAKAAKRRNDPFYSRATKLSKSDILSIRQCRAKGETLTSIAARYGTSHGHIWLITKGHLWKHL